MLLREVDYVRPETTDEAVRALSEHPGARPLAGGQTLINVMKQRAAAPDVLVDLGRLADLRTIERGADGSLVIGAMVTLAQLIESGDVASARPVLAEVASTIADTQVRNRGTIGGNVCVNDPTNHLPPLIVAVDATLTIRSAAGQRVVSAEDFFLGVYETAVAEGELLTHITIPAAGKGDGDAMEGLTLGRHGTYVASAAASLHGGSWRIVLGCVAAVPLRATDLEQRLAGAELVEPAVRQAAAGLAASLDPPSDVHADADYRKHLAETSAVRAVLRAAERARG